LELSRSCFSSSPAMVDFRRLSTKTGTANGSEEENEMRVVMMMEETQELQPEEARAGSGFAAGDFAGELGRDEESDQKFRIWNFGRGIRSWCVFYDRTWAIVEKMDWIGEGGLQEPLDFLKLHFLDF
jgi:hypothetical protein